MLRAPLSALRPRPGRMPTAQAGQDAEPANDGSGGTLRRPRRPGSHGPCCMSCRRSCSTWPRPSTTRSRTAQSAMHWCIAETRPSCSLHGSLQFAIVLASGEAASSLAWRCVGGFGLAWVLRGGTLVNGDDSCVERCVDVRGVNDLLDTCTARVSYNMVMSTV